MSEQYYNTIVIGAGPAGYSAAIGTMRKRRDGSCLILEKQQKPGRKLLATGSGRCNISNEGVSPEHYHGDGKLIASVLSRFSVQDMKDFLRGIGVLVRSDIEGRIYPCSNQAATVLDALRRESKRLGVIETAGMPVTAVTRQSGGFTVTAGGSSFVSDRLVIATGSAASPSLGADNSGYELLRTLDVRVSPLFPSLSPVAAKEKYKGLKGVRAKGSVTLLCDGTPADTRSGEIQFTDTGISGICVFELSRRVNEYLLYGTVDGRPVKDCRIRADVMSELDFGEIAEYLEECRVRLGEESAAMIFSGALNPALSAAVVRSCGLEGMKCSGLSRHHIKTLASAAKKLTFTPKGPPDFRSAQVSAGGVGSDMTDPRTLMCRRIKNLFLCGEVLNVDGDCGGFNLHFAIGSGLLTASSL